MALSNGPNLGLLVNAAQGEAHFAAQQKLLRGLDALVQSSVKDKDLATPPGTPADGDRYIVAAAPTGAWVGHAAEIARWSSVATAWEFYAPKAGWRMYVVDEAVIYTYTGAVWSATVTRKMPIPMANNASALFLAWPDSITTTLLLLFPIPGDYVSGDLLVKIFRRGAASGTALFKENAFRFRDNVGVSPFVVDNNIDFTPLNTNSRLLSLPMDAASFQAGDVIRLDIQRAGGDAGDTMIGVVDYDGGWVEYTGWA